MDLAPTRREPGTDKAWAPVGPGEHGLVQLRTQRPDARLPVTSRTRHRMPARPRLGSRSSGTPTQEPSRTRRRTLHPAGSPDRNSGNTPGHLRLEEVRRAIEGTGSTRGTAFATGSSCLGPPLTSPPSLRVTLPASTCQSSQAGRPPVSRRNGAGVIRSDRQAAGQRPLGDAAEGLVIGDAGLVARGGARVRRAGALGRDSEKRWRRRVQSGGSTALVWFRTCLTRLDRRVVAVRRERPR